MSSGQWELERALAHPMQPPIPLSRSYDSATAEIVALRARVALLEAENVCLREALVPCAHLPEALGLSHSETILVRALYAASPAIVAHRALLYLLAGAVKFDTRCLAKAIQRVRDKLEGDEIFVDCTRSLGYAMPLSSARKLAALIAREAA